MKVRYSRVYRHHWAKAPYTYVKSKQKKTVKGLSNKKLTSYVQGNIAKQNQLLGSIEVHVKKHTTYYRCKYGGV